VHSQTLTCQGVQCKEDECEIAEIVIPYDRLVVAVGAKVNTFGIPGVEEHCFFLKQVADARAIRRRVVDLFEKANFPGLSEKEIRKMLTFVISK
jgi:NADH dehydrogenase FAD-containing subunit